MKFPRIKRAWQWLRFGDIKEVVVDNINGIPCEIKYLDRKGRIVGYWATGRMATSIPASLTADKILPNRRQTGAGSPTVGNSDTMTLTQKLAAMTAERDALKRERDALKKELDALKAQAQVLARLEAAVPRIERVVDARTPMQRVR